MHTVRNRHASKTRAEADRSRRGAKHHDANNPPGQGPPPRFPSDLSVPPQRGPVMTSAFFPTPDCGPEMATPAVGGRKAIRKAERRAAALARAAAAAQKVWPTTEDLIILPAVVPPLPDTAQPELSSLEPTAMVDEALPIAAVAPVCAPQQSAIVEEPAPVAVTPVPIANSRALVPRRQGFVDVIAFALRDSGRRLARWSSARRRADDMKEKLARAETRMRAMEAQLAALQALQDRVRNAG